ncbi:LacI family transcriptional regulator [Paenibacillus sp. FSL H8-0548]|uniref:LacI family DNA-binding transcriptional regulator n=1 Tax=Paenibacillus sp. FSL H8-0548 TaxID=1920422 RepID=UPI00096CBC99|nr:LacI family DNA-binding transcriptional regulator [Paenibacillus sp. FSL H8-0548]OMF26707.1 LacI family transcriptional regulator [Paenibacillus sp. FSL H8-0548]
MKITIYDVAREAGVSIAAVSQVINGKGKISEQRRHEIIQVMERLNYQPSAIASALTGKKTFTIGLLVPDISNPFFAEIARAVEDQSHNLGYGLFICSTDNNKDRAERYLSLMQQKRVDGMIIGTGIANKSTLASLVKSKLPVVVIAREAKLGAKTVIIDDFCGGGMAANHLLEQNHSHVGLLSENEEVSSSRERIRGFLSVWEQAGLRIEEGLIQACGDELVRDGKAKATELLSSANPPSALFCCNDLLAIGALQAAKGLGLRVPEQVSIIGFDNTILAEVTDPPLTTIAQPTKEMGQIAVDSLVAMLEDGNRDDIRIVLQPELVIRQSTAKKQ